MALLVGLLALAALVTFSILGFFALREYRGLQTARPSSVRRPATAPRPPPNPVSPIRRPRRSRSGGIVGTLLLSGLLLVAGLWEWSNFGFRGEWPTVQGTILGTRFTPPQADDDERHAQIQFRYAVAGRQFTSPWVDQSSGDTFNTADFVAQHQPGQPLTIWYHPLLPSYPSLSRVTLWYPVVALVLGVVLLVAGLVSLSRMIVRL